MNPIRRVVTLLQNMQTKVTRSHVYLGATDRTNNAAELSALGEALLWVLNEAPGSNEIPILIRYDSEYAAQMAHDNWTPSANIKLVEKVRALLGTSSGV